MFTCQGVLKTKRVLNEGGGIAGCLAPHKAATSVGSLVWNEWVGEWSSNLISIENSIVSG